MSIKASEVLTQLQKATKHMDTQGVAITIIVVDKENTCFASDAGDHVADILLATLSEVIDRIRDKSSVSVVPIDPRMLQ